MPPNSFSKSHHTCSFLSSVLLRARFNARVCFVDPWVREGVAVAPAARHPVGLGRDAGLPAGGRRLLPPAAATPAVPLLLSEGTVREGPAPFASRAGANGPAAWPAHAAGTTWTPPTHRPLFAFRSPAPLVPRCDQA